MDNKLEYDVEKRARAGTRATLRGAVCLYLIYLGYQILQGTQEGTSTMPLWAGWVAGIAFILAALGFGYYTLRTYRRDREAARLTNQEELPEDTE